MFYPITVIFLIFLRISEEHEFVLDSKLHTKFYLNGLAGDILKALVEGIYVNMGRTGHDSYNASISDVDTDYEDYDFGTGDELNVGRKLYISPEKATTVKPNRANSTKLGCVLRTNCTANKTVDSKAYSDFQNSSDNNKNCTRKTSGEEVCTVIRFMNVTTAIPVNCVMKISETADGNTTANNNLRVNHNAEIINCSIHINNNITNNVDVNHTVFRRLMLLNHNTNSSDDKLAGETLQSIDIPVYQEPQRRFKIVNHTDHPNGFIFGDLTISKINVHPNINEINNMQVNGTNNKEVLKNHTLDSIQNSNVPILRTVNVTTKFKVEHNTANNSNHTNSNFRDSSHVPDGNIESTYSNNIYVNNITTNNNIPRSYTNQAPKNCTVNMYTMPLNCTTTGSTNCTLNWPIMDTNTMNCTTNSTENVV